MGKLAKSTGSVGPRTKPCTSPKAKANPVNATKTFSAGTGPRPKPTK